MPTVEELYGELWAGDRALEAELDRSLDPRPAESLYDAFAELGVESSDVVLDVGCGEGTHSVELARRFDCQIVALDLIPRRLESARERIEKEGLEGRIRVVEARAESLPPTEPSTTSGVATC